MSGSEAVTRRVRFDLAYDGTDFAGWQVQPGQRTVQGLLQDALSRIQGDRSVTLRGAGRTDAGVHARQQVADCEFRSSLDDERLAHSLRRMLPGDVRVWRVHTVGGEFHARRDASSKTYRYRLDLTAHGDPFTARFALHQPQRLDDVALKRALGELPGRRDWSGFTAAGCDVEDRVRTMTEARFERVSEEEARLTFRADGFLQYMVRNLVGTLLEIARGRMPADSVARILAARDRGLAGPTAPAKGLCLERVDYPRQGPTEAGSC